MLKYSRTSVLSSTVDWSWVMVEDGVKDLVGANALVVESVRERNAMMDVFIVTCLLAC